MYNTLDWYPAFLDYIYHNSYFSKCLRVIIIKQQLCCVSTDADEDVEV